MEKAKIEPLKKRVPINTTVDSDILEKFKRKCEEESLKPGRVLDVLMKRYYEEDEIDE